MRGFVSETEDGLKELIGWANSYTRMGVIIEAAGQLPDDEWLRCLGEAWSICDNIADHIDDLIFHVFAPSQKSRRFVTPFFTVSPEFSASRDATGLEIRAPLIQPCSSPEKQTISSSRPMIGGPAGRMMANRLDLPRSAATG